MSHVLVVLSNPVEGQEDEYNEWYSDRHLADVVALDGFVSAQRFRIDDASARSDPPYRYLAIYEIEDGKLEAARAALSAARRAGTMEVSESIDADRKVWYFTAMTDRIVPQPAERVTP